MPTITQFMHGRRWTLGPAPDYYFPGRNHPHLHLRVRNGLTIVNNEREVREEITFLGITLGGRRGNVQIYPTPNPWPGGNDVERAESEEAWKDRISQALIRYFPNGVERISILGEINTLTGLGIDTDV
ncbi:hypothetical protein FNH22_30145 [Fulvivirga sp. M361]|uniref:hypothetical protein n=1 Tax=Fulvivirga sp. M361 TaxID=2594266 RepID=UPI00117AA05B|nr:hypothetical protein [Fulvivirga sp. M361]TRX47251.1 hypothetical protein FNH22_30145 [Fulvivirga sp. M361]